MTILEEILQEVKNEVERATKLHGPFASRHEGYAIMKEEVDELWWEVKHGTPEAAREEAIQVAAMAVRFIMDLYVEKKRE